MNIGILAMSNTRKEEIERLTYESQDIMDKFEADSDIQSRNGIESLLDAIKRIERTPQNESTLSSHIKKMREDFVEKPKVPYSEEFKANAKLIIQKFAEIENIEIVENRGNINNREPEKGIKQQPNEKIINDKKPEKKKGMFSSSLFGGKKEKPASQTKQQDNDNQDKKKLSPK